MRSWRSRAELAAAFASLAVGLAGLTLAFFTPNTDHESSFYNGLNPGSPTLHRVWTTSLWQDEGPHAFVLALPFFVLLVVFLVSATVDVRRRSDSARALVVATTASLVCFSLISAMGANPYGVFVLPAVLLSLVASYFALLRTPNHTLESSADSKPR